MHLQRHFPAITTWLRGLFALVLAVTVLTIPATPVSASSSVTGFYWVDQDWLVAEFSGTGLDVQWKLDGQALESANDYAYDRWWRQHGDVMGKYCVRVRAGSGSWSAERCIANIDPAATSTTTSSISVSWDSVTYDPTVNFLVVYLDGEIVTYLPTNATSYTYAGLQEGTSYSVGVYPAMSQGEQPRLNNVSISTASSDTAAPSRPGWGRFWSQTANSITLKWAASSDNVGVAGYRVRLGSGSRINLPASARSYTFNNVAPGRHRVDVVAVDAAGNISTQRAAYQNVQSSAAQTATRAAVQDIVAAIEAFGAANGNYTDIGGSAGTGWFAYKNGTSYPEKINTTLINAGFLDATYATVAYSDYMIYRCGSGDDARVGVFGFMPTGTAVDADWAGCTESPFYYGHHFFGVTRTLAEVQDTTAPSRPGWNGYQFDGNSATFSWKASTDDVGVVAYRARLEGTGFDVTLPATALSHTFDDVPGRTGRYMWNVTAIDAAGNVSVARRTSFRILTAAENAATITAVDDVVAALEAYALDNGDFQAGASTAGNGWFNYSNGTSYPSKMAANLVDGGYLDEQYRTIYYWDLMVRQCGSGDDQRVAVLSTADKTTSAADVAEFAGCSQSYATRYGHDYYRVTQRLSNIQAVDTEAPTTVWWDVDSQTYNSIALSWPLAADNVGVDRYEVIVDGAIVASLPAGQSSYVVQDLTRASLYDIDVRAADAAGNVSPQGTRTIATHHLVPLPRIQPTVEWVRGTSMFISWETPDNDASIEAYGIFVNDENVIWLDPQMDSFIIDQTADGAALTPGTNYDVGVYAVELDYAPGPLEDNLQVRTTLGDLPPTQPAMGIWGTSQNSITINWGYSDNGQPIAADDTGIDFYYVTLEGQTLDATIKPGDRSFTFTGLFADTEYTVQVTAVDEDGNATQSVVKTARTDVPPPPPTTTPSPAADTVAPIWGGTKPPQIQAVDVVEPGAVLISWCCALDFDQYNVVPASFDVFTKPASAASSAYQLVENINTYNTGGSTTLSGLTENSQYSVLIVAIDWVGNRSVGLERHGVVPRGGPVLPEPAPVNGVQVSDPAPQAPPSQPVDTYTNPEPEPVFEVLIPESVEADPALAWECVNTEFRHKSSPNSIQIEWSGDLGGHASYFVNASDPQTNGLVGQFVTPSGPEANINGLASDTAYWIDIQAFDADDKKIGRCRYWTRTDREPVPDPPAVPTGPCVALTRLDDVVTVSWEEIPQAEFYDVRLVPIGGSNELTRVSILGASERQISYSGLEPGGEYFFIKRPLFAAGIDPQPYSCSDTFHAPRNEFGAFNSAWGVCLGAGGSVIAGVDGNTCWFVNAYGEWAQVTSLGISLGLQVDVGFEGIAAVATTTDLESLGGWSRCGGTAPIPAGPSVSLTFCRAGFWGSSGPGVTYLGIGGGVGVNVIAVGLSHSKVTTSVEVPAGTQEKMCDLLRRARVETPDFCWNY